MFADTRPAELDPLDGGDPWAEFRVANPRERLALHGRFLESFKGTVVRQTQFAEFELAIHEKAHMDERIHGAWAEE